MAKYEVGSTVRIKRNRRGQFARTAKPYAVLVVVIGVLLGMAWNGLHGPVVVAHAEDTPEEIGKMYLGAKVDALKDELVDDIAQCESGGKNGLIIFDSNNEASIGSLQFQRKTVEYYAQLFEGQTLTDADAIALAINHDRAHELAKRIIFSEKDGWQNWLNCGRKVDAATRIAIISSLQ